MIRFVATLLLVCFCAALHAQSDDRSEEFTRSILKTRNGVMVVYNSDARGFSIQMRADSIRALDQSDFMELDGTLFQASLVPVPTSQAIDTLTQEQQRAVLKAYVPYELKYFADNHIDCVNVKTVYMTLGGHLFIRWSFDVLPGQIKDRQTICPGTGLLFYRGLRPDPGPQYAPPKTHRYVCGV